MFSFFQKKASLIAMFPENFVDIHSHFLPAIDDGSKNMEESVALLRRMQGYGINSVICTPHVMESVWENTSETIQQKLNALNAHLKSIEFTDISVRAAAEYMLDSNFNRLLKAEKLRTLKDNIILVEMSYLNAPIDLYETLFNIQIAGYKPILAHPERYLFFHNHYEEYKKLKEAGCLFQLNLLSLSPYYGKNVQAMAFKLLKDHFIDFVGSDTHSHKHLDFLETITDKKIIKLIQPVLEKNEIFL